MDDSELERRFAEELEELEGAILPLHFNAAQAFTLMAALQLALRHPGMKGPSRAFVEELARNIEGRLCQSSAMAEVARRGWNPEYDVQKEDAESQAAGRAEAQARTHAGE